jgi:hypothetical protein
MSKKLTIKEVKDIKEVKEKSLINNEIVRK